LQTFDFFLDSTFFKDQYKGTLFAATACDGDNGLFALAYCVCDIENKDNWNWFISGLRKMLYEVPELYAPLHQLVFITDADKGLGSTIEQYFSDACTLVVCSLSWKITRTVIKKN